MFFLLCVGANTVRDGWTDESQTMRGEVFESGRRSSPAGVTISETSKHLSYLLLTNPSHTDVLYGLFIEDKNITFTAQPDSYQKSNTNPKPSDK